MRYALTLSIAAMLMTIPGVAQEKKTPSKSTQDSAMAEAIRFERAKDAADARQAKLEAEHPCGCATPAEAAAAAAGERKPVSQRASTNTPRKK